ncbi:MAG: deoxyguanosinetriphosphate triphosphohydrolase [Methyloversatilis sp.]|nr:deoxyguanosinetriphosphate triphosphohydrolase [Methyloversatilis sp.]
MTELAPYAACEGNSLGRVHAEDALSGRSQFQRDRDRIIHSTAFRRLEYKTQVFVNHEGDLFRTRLTHSIEVAQIARSIARALRVNEDLVEAISLSHDLGHTPFGHAGQDALNECMREHGGFEHNLQSLRTVDLLEERYGAFDGLNLTFETREGILKHCSPARAKDLGDLGRRFIERTQPTIEAQICNLADEIAYNAHDIDDGVRSGLITMEQLESVPLFEGYRLQALREHPQLAEADAGRRLLYETIRRMLSAQVYDVIETTQNELVRLRPQSVAEIRHLPALMSFSAEMRERSIVLKKFLFQNLYRHPNVMQTTGLARQVIQELFDCYRQRPDEMQSGHAARARAAQGVEDSEGVVLRVVADYIAGMTDRFAGREHERLTGKRLWG